MGISGKDVQVWMWRVVKFSMGCAYTLIKNHPFVSCPVLFFLVLYICFRSFFWILIYSLSFLILVVLVIKIYLRHRNAKSFKRVEKNSDAEESIRKDTFAKNDATNNGNEKCFRRALSVRRRKPRETSRDSSLHTSDDEKKTIFLSTSNGDMVDKSALTEERPKEIRDIKIDSIISNVDYSSSDVSSSLRSALHKKRSKNFGGGAGGEMEMESSEGTEDEDEQERQANNKAVQWTETDQKNPRELGLSEIERNKRLESLIARRRARKMFSFQIRRSVEKMNNPENPGPMIPLMIPKTNNPFHAIQSNDIFSSMPGSAPSILLPNKNPFDLPYDAQEEKPILTGGSFQLEFKDMTLIRPENMGSEASISGKLKEDQQKESLSHDSTKNEGVIKGGLQKFPVKCQSGEKDTSKIIEVESWQSPVSNLNTFTATPVIKNEIPDSKQEMDFISSCEEENNSQIQTKSLLIEDSVDISPASLSEDEVSMYKVDKDAVLRSLRSPSLKNISMNREGSSRMECVRNNYDLSVIDKSKMQDHFYYAHKPMMHHYHHNPMSSIASDLQVEFSEVSSPGLTDDGSSLFPDEEFSAYKEVVGNDRTTDNEDIREPSSQLKQVDENESKEDNITEDNAMEVGFSRTNESVNDDVPHDLAEMVIGNNANDSPSKESASEAELSNRSEDHSSSFHANTKDNFPSSTSSDLFHKLASDNLAFPVMDKVQQLKGDLVAIISQNDDSVTPEQPSHLSLKSEEELSTIYNVDDSKVLQNNDEEFNIRETDDIVDMLIEQGIGKPTELSETSNSSPVDYTGSQPEKIKEHHSISELVGKNVNAKVSEDIEGELKETKQDKMDDSAVIQDNETPESFQVNDGEQHREELGTSGVHTQFIHHQVQAVLPELVLEQSHVDSSASSPRSVLQPGISLDPSSISSFSGDTQMEIHQFHPQRVENSLLDEGRGEGLTSTVSQSTMLLMVDSSSYPLHEDTAQTLEESSNHSTSTNVANSTGSVREEDMVQVNENKQSETDYISEGSLERLGSGNLSKSTEEANSSGSLNQDRIHEDERRENETHSIPGDSGRQDS